MNGLLSGIGWGAVVSGGMTVIALTVMPVVNVGPDTRGTNPTAAAPERVAPPSDPSGDDGLFTPGRTAPTASSGKAPQDIATPAPTEAPSRPAQEDGTADVSSGPEPRATKAKSEPLKPTQPPAFDLAGLSPSQPPRGPDASLTEAPNPGADTGISGRQTAPDRPSAVENPGGFAAPDLAPGPDRAETESASQLDPAVPEAFELADLTPSRVRSNPGAPSAISRRKGVPAVVPRRPRAPARAIESAAPKLAQGTLRGDARAQIAPTEAGQATAPQFDAASLGTAFEPAVVDVMAALGPMSLVSAGSLGIVGPAVSDAAMRPSIDAAPPSTLDDASGEDPPVTGMSAPLRPARVAARTRLASLDAPVFDARGTTRLPEGPANARPASLDSPALPRPSSDATAGGVLQRLGGPDGLSVLSRLAPTEAPVSSVRPDTPAMWGDAPRAVPEPRRPDAPDRVADTPDPIAAPARSADPSVTKGDWRSVAATPRVQPSLPQVGVERDAPGSPDSTTMAEPPADALSRHAVAFEETRPLPRLAIVLLDDPTAPIVEEPRLSVAIAADSPDAAARAQAWRDAGQEIVLIPALPDGTVQDIAQSLHSSLIAVPTAASVMPAQDGGFAGGGNAAAQDVISRIADTGHGLLTRPNGLDATARRADRAGVPNRPVGRRVDEGGRDARTIARFLDGAAFDANRRGENIVLASNSEATRTALAVWINASRAQTVTLVPVSALLLDE